MHPLRETLVDLHHSFCVPTFNAALGSRCNQLVPNRLHEIFTAKHSEPP